MRYSLSGRLAKGRQMRRKIMRRTAVLAVLVATFTFPTITPAWGKGRPATAHYTAVGTCTSGGSTGEFIVETTFWKKLVVRGATAQLYQDGSATGSVYTFTNASGLSNPFEFV